MTRPGEPLEHDWYPRAIPQNIQLGKDVYLDSAYAFAAFHSRQKPGLVLGNASGAYDRATFVVGPYGQVIVGDYTCLNGTYLICNDRIHIGSHCLFSWGVVITDSPVGIGASVAARRKILQKAATNPVRWLPPLAEPRPVTIEDNVWIGFDAIVEPGVNIGRGAIIGCKSRVCENVPPYAVVVGSPGHVVQHLTPDDQPVTAPHFLGSLGIVTNDDTS